MSKRSLPLVTEEIELIREVEEFIKINFSHIHSRDDIVKQFNHEKKHFLNWIFLRQHYTTICGIPPMKHVRKLRLQKAIEMLLNRDKLFSIKEIAEAVGLTFTGFIIFFKKETGMSPGKYRKANWITFSPE